MRAEARGGSEPPGARGAPPINRIEITVAESQSLTLCTGIDLYSNKYPCQVVPDKGAWDAPPLNRIAVTETGYRFSSSQCFSLSNIITYWLLYSCQVVLDKIVLNTITYKIPLYRNFARQYTAYLITVCYVFALNFKYLKFYNSSSANALLITGILNF